jgi:TPR repeat protein
MDPPNLAAAIRASEARQAALNDAANSLVRSTSHAKLQRMAAAGSSALACSVLSGMLNPDHPDRAMLTELGVMESAEEYMLYLRKAAELGHAHSQGTLSILLREQGDSQGALTWGLRAAQTGEGKGMLVAGSMLLSSEGGVEVDVQRGFDLLRRAAALGESAAGHAVGKELASGALVAADAVRAAAWYEFALALAVAQSDHCAAAKATECLRLLRCPQEAAAVAALAGIARACALPACSAPLAPGAEGLCSNCQAVRYCGVQCQRLHWKEHKAPCKAARGGAGKVSSADADTAAAEALIGTSTRPFPVRLFSTPEKEVLALRLAERQSGDSIRAAADAGDPVSLFVAALYMLSSEDSSSSGGGGGSVGGGAGALAQRFIAQAAEAGIGRAQQHLSALLRDEGKDWPAALHWAQAAAAHHFTGALCSLGYLLYYFGVNGKGGTVEDMRRAQGLFLLDRARGSADACAMLGDMLRRGQLVPAVDLQGALAYFEEAQALGKDCKEDIARLRKEISHSKGTDLD